MLRYLLVRTLSTSRNSFQQFVPRSATTPESTKPIRKLPYVARLRTKAPLFKCPAVVEGAFKTVSLTDYIGKNLVVLFYPMDFTYVCPTEVTAFNDRIDDFRALNTEVVAISVDSINSHLAWTKSPRSDGGLGPTRIPLLSDIHKNVSKSYSVLDSKKGISLRGTFIIDKNGILRQSTVNDFEIGRNVDETLRLVQAMVHADEHGEVCPVNWKKGEPAIKPVPEQAAKYFKAAHNENASTPE